MTFDEFLDAHLAALSRFAGSLTGDAYLAEDMLGDALVKVARQWRKVSTADDPEAYVRRIVVTTYLSDRRKFQRRRTAPTADPAILDRPVPDTAEEVLSRDEIARLIARLPQQQKAAVVMRYVLDEPDERIAAALNCSAATVRSHLAHARATLRLAVTSPDPVSESGRE